MAWHDIRGAASGEVVQAREAIPSWNRTGQVSTRDYVEKRTGRQRRISHVHGPVTGRLLEYLIARPHRGRRHGHSLGRGER